MKFKNILIMVILILVLSSFAIAGDPFRVDENLEMGTNDIYNATNINATRFYGTLVGSWTPSGNVNMGEGSIFNVSEVNSTYIYQNGSLVLDQDDLNDSTWNYSNYANYSSYANSSFYWDSLNSPTDITSLGTISSATSITSTAFVGALTGNADTVTNGVYTTDFPLNQDTTGTASIATTWDGETSQLNLNVNSSDYWDALGSPADITGLVDSQILTLNGSKIQNMDIGCLADTYQSAMNFTDESITCTAISDVYLLNSGDTGTGAYIFTGGTFDTDTLNTGQGDYELYAMNQDVLTTSDVTFNNINTPSIRDVSTQSLIIATNFNSETIIGLAGSEIILDSSTNNNHGNNIGATFNSKSGLNNGGSFKFDGIDSRLSFGDIDETEGNTSLSVCTWAILDSYTSGSDGLICKSIGGTRSWCLQKVSATQLRSRVYFDSGNTEILYTVTNDLEEHNYCFTYDKDTFIHSLYYDGDLVGTDETPTGTIKETIAEIYVGRSYTGGAGYTWNGSIDNVEIYNRTLSADDIRSNYEQRTEIKNSYVSQKDVTVDKNGNVGIGTTSPSSYYSLANNLVVGGSGHNGMSIVSSTDSLGFLAFADGTVGNQAYRGNFKYNHADDSLHITTGGIERMAIDNSGNVGIGVVIPSAKLDVVGDAEINGDLDVTGNITGNLYYGGMYVKGNAVATTVTSSGVYYNVTQGMTSGSLNGFTHSSGVLTATNAGTYKLDSSVSFSGGNDDDYHTQIAINNVAQDQCHSSRTMSATGVVGNIGLACIISVSASDEITLQMENVDASADFTVEDANIVVTWLGN